MLTAAGLLVIAADRLSVQPFLKRSEVRVSNRVIFLLKKHRSTSSVDICQFKGELFCVMKVFGLFSEFKVTHDGDVIYPKFGLKFFVFSIWSAQLFLLHSPVIWRAVSFRFSFLVSLCSPFTFLQVRLGRGHAAPQFRDPPPAPDGRAAGDGLRPAQ